MGMFIFLLLFIIPEIMWVYFGTSYSDQDTKNRQWTNPYGKKKKDNNNK